MKTVRTKNGTELPLTNLKGKDYLMVAYRLVWFREENPTHRIETSFVTISEETTIAKAVISDSEGRILATAHKREDAKHFPDHLEKAETGAIGRALALFGYGTQFTDELDEGERVVDSPLQTKSQPIQPQKTIANIPVKPLPQNNFRRPNTL